VSIHFGKGAAAASAIAVRMRILQPDLVRNLHAGVACAACYLGIALVQKDGRCPSLPHVSVTPARAAPRRAAA